MKSDNQLEAILDINASSYTTHSSYLNLMFLNENAVAVDGVDCYFPIPTSDNPVVFKRLSANTIQYRNSPTT